MEVDTFSLGNTHKPVPYLVENTKKIVMHGTMRIHAP